MLAASGTRQHAGEDPHYLFGRFADHAREALPPMFNAIKRFWNDESGQGLVEYALILFLVAIVVIVALTTLGKKANNVFQNVSNAINA